MKINPKDKTEIIQRVKLFITDELRKLQKTLENEFRKIIRNVFTSKIMVNDKDEHDVFLPALMVQSLQFYQKANKDLVKEVERSKQAVIDIERKLNEVDANIRFILKNVDFKVKK